MLALELASSRSPSLISILVFWPRCKAGSFGSPPLLGNRMLNVKIAPGQIPGLGGKLTIMFSTFEENRSATTSLKSAFAAVVIINAAAALTRQARTVVLPLSFRPH